PAIKRCSSSSAVSAYPEAVRRSARERARAPVRPHATPEPRENPPRERVQAEDARRLCALSALRFFPAIHQYSFGFVAAWKSDGPTGSRRGFEGTDLRCDGSYCVLKPQ